MKLSTIFKALVHLDAEGLRPVALSLRSEQFDSLLLEASEATMYNHPRDPLVGEVELNRVDVMAPWGGYVQFRRAP